MASAVTPTLSGLCQAGASGAQRQTPRLLISSGNVHSQGANHSGLWSPASLPWGHLTFDLPKLGPSLRSRPQCGSHSSGAEVSGEVALPARGHLGGAGPATLGVRLAVGAVG